MSTRPQSTFGVVNKKFGQLVQLTAELTGKATRSDVDDEFKALQAQYERKKSYVDQMATDMRALVASVHSKGSEKQPPIYSIVGQEMIMAGSDLPEESAFGASLVKCGEALEKMSDSALEWETRVREGFLNPLYHLQETEMKEMQHQKKKLENRRLDYDAKRTNFEKSKKPDIEAEMNAAKAKYTETVQTMRDMMTQITTNEEMEMKQLSSFVEAMRSFFESGLQTFTALSQTLTDPSVKGTRRVRAQPPPAKQTSSSTNVSAASQSGGVVPDADPDEAGDNTGDAGAASSDGTPAPGGGGSGGGDGEYNPFLDEAAAAAAAAAGPPKSPTAAPKKEAAAAAKPAVKAPKPDKPPKPEGDTGGAMSLLSRATSGATSLMDKLKGSKKDEKPTISGPISAEPIPLPKPPKAAGDVDKPLPSESAAASLMDAPVPKPRAKPAAASTAPDGGEKYVAAFDFVPDQDDELPFKKGDTITVVRKIDESWWVGEFNGKRGLLPSNFLAPA